MQVHGETHEAETIVVNAGAHATEPPIEGLANVPWLDNARIMELNRLPGHLIVVGDGFIGCEFAQMFRRFGAEVTVIEPRRHLLSREDEEVSATLEEVFRKEGISLRLDDRVSAVACTQTGLEAKLEGGDCIEGTHILVATGRTPNTADLGECAGVDLDERGFSSSTISTAHLRTACSQRETSRAVLSSRMSHGTTTDCCSICSPDGGHRAVPVDSSRT